MPRSQTTSPAAPQPSGDSARVPTIDLLRGMAILLVILYHLDNQIILQGGWGLVRGADGIAHLAAGGKLLRFLLLPFHMGRVGVNLFFVISGLCIHLRFARAQAANPAAPFSLRTFFLRRFFRI
jgi:peptidoglycan/LPS O-acetylase OafA/YrhL